MKKKFLSNLILVLVLNIVIKPFYILGIDAEILKITEQNSPGSYGTYFSLLSLAFIFNIILDMGVNNFNTRNIAQNNQLLQKHFSKIFSLKLILSIFYISVLFIVGLIFNFSFQEMKWLIIIGFNQILVALILFIRSNMSALLLFKKDSVLSVTDRLILIFFCGYFIWSIGDDSIITIDFFILSQTIAYLITLIAGFLLLVKHSKFPKLKWDQLFFKMIVKKSLPYALLIFLMSVYYYSDVVMVERIRGNIEVANYAHGYRFFMAFNMLGYLFAGLLLPIFSKLIKEKKSVVPVSWLSFKLIYFFALIICVTVWTYKVEIIHWRYEINGSLLLHSSETFGWLIISFIAVSCNYIFGTLLTAKGSMKQLNILAVFGILINISLNLLLIPDKGSSGAAFASAFTQFFILAFQIALCYKIFNFKSSLLSIIQISSFSLLFILLVYTIENNLNINWLEKIVLNIIGGGIIGLFLKVINWKQFYNVIKHDKSS
jgi:O-antigen/teichoic acid export membrane protein